MRFLQYIFAAVFFLLIYAHCTNTTAEKKHANAQNTSTINAEGKTISSRFLLPAGFYRKTQANNSFAAFLRNFPLKPDGTKVKLYNGDLKINQDVSAAVLDIETGTENLQQCADAVMRLRAEYLYKTQQYNKIHFNFTNGFRADYNKWMQGNRIVVKGENVSWKKAKDPSNSYNDFRAYLYMVFRYAGTLSLSKELKPVSVKDIQVGDVFIKGGSPGHAVIVADVAENNAGEKIFMLAQSYMPAQDMHVLVNLEDTHISPWYKMPAENLLQTPEWTFTTDQLMRFVEE
jgi:hypothetical protein